MDETEEKRNHRRQFEGSGLEEKPSLVNRAIFVLLCVIPVFSTIAFGAVDALAMSALSLLAAVLLILWIADAWPKREFRFDSSAMQLPILGLILIGCVQLLPISNPGVSADLLNIPVVSSLSLDPYATRFFLIRLIICLIFFSAALTHINTRERLQKIVLVIIVFGSAMAFLGILQWLANPEGIYGLRPTPQAIPFGSFVNQHHFAAFMEMTAGVTLGLLFGDATRKDKKLLLGMAAAVMGIAVIFTSSRGGVISFLGVLGFVISIQPSAVSSQRSGETGNAKRKLILAAGSVALILVILGTVVYLGGGELLLRAIGLQNNQADVTSGRLHFWSAAWQIFLANPILGAGFDAFGVAFSRYDTLHGQFRVEQAHNDYLQILTDAGIFGFACAAAFIFLLFKKSLDLIRISTDPFRRGTAVGALAGCFGILIHSFFDFPLRTPSNTFFFLLLIVMATVSLGLQRKENI